MKKSRFTDEQIIGVLKQVEGGVPVKDLCRKHGFNDAMFYRWRSRPADVPPRGRAGFSLHASVDIAPQQRQKLERLCR